MTKARRGLRVQWIGYHSLHHGKIVSLNRRKGIMMLRTDSGSPWQARKIGDEWCAYSGSDTFTFTLYVEPLVSG